MSRVNELIFSLNAGAVDKDALTRVDLEKLRLAGEHPVTNWLPRVLGPMSIRPGLEHLDLLSQQVRLVEFVRDSTTTALLVFGNQTVTIYGSDGQPVQVANAATTITNPSFAFGGGGWSDVSDTGDGTDGVVTVNAGAEFVATKYRAAALQQSVSVAGGEVSIAHTIRITVSRGPIYFRVGTSSGGEEALTEQRLSTGVHKLTFTPGATTIYLRFRSEDPVVRLVSDCRFEHTALSGVGDLVLPTPWSTADLEFLAWDQSADVLFVGDGTYQPRRIERRGASSWSIVPYQTRNGPLQRPSTDKVRLSGAAIVKNGNLTSNIPYFKSSHVGCLFELTHAADFVQEELNALAQHTDHVTVRGLFSSSVTFDDRNLGLTLNFSTGTFVGVVALERSTDVDAEVWSVVDDYNTDLSTTYNDEQSNLLCHYRFRVTSYTSGYCTATLNYAAGSTTGLVRVTSYSSATQVGYEVVKRLSSTGPTSDWRGPAWSDALGWPRVPQFRDDRLHWFLGGRDHASIVDDYDNFDDSTVGDSGPINRSVGSGADEGVRWALDMDRFVVGTSGFIAAIQASDFNEVITPTSYSVRPGPTLGASFVPPVQIDDIALMADKTNTRLYDVAVPGGETKVKSTDVSRLNPSAVNGIVDMAVQRQPDTRVYIVLEDGTCSVLTYEREDKVVAFNTIDVDGTIEGVAVLPGTRQDDVYFVVSRLGTRRLERLANEADQRALATCTPLDAFKVLTGSVSSITGATHLASQTVHVFADGLYRGTVALNGSGVASLGATYARVVYGLSYDAEFLSVKLAYAAQLGTAVGQTKRVGQASPVFSRSVLDGIRIGTASDRTDPMPDIVDGAARTAGQFFTHYDKAPFPIAGDWDADSRFYIKASSHYGPVTVQAIAIDVETRDGAGNGNRR